MRSAPRDVTGRVLRVAAVFLAILAAGAQAARAQAGATEAQDAPSFAAVPCSEINNRAMEATLVIRQHASALSMGFEADARPQALQLLAWLDQWSGRLRGLVDLGEYSLCLDEGDAETYRRALASAARVGNGVREDLLRPARPAQQPHRPRR